MPKTGDELLEKPIALIYIYGRVYISCQNQLAYEEIFAALVLMHKSFDAITSLIVTNVTAQRFKFGVTISSGS